MIYYIKFLDEKVEDVILYLDVPKSNFTVFRFNGVFCGGSFRIHSRLGRDLRGGPSFLSFGWLG